MRKKIIFCLFALVLLTQKTLLADVYVYGHVYDTNDHPLNGVKVSTSDAYKIHTSYSEDQGYYDLWLLNQNYTLKYEKQGYETQTKNIDLKNTYNYLQVERVTLTKLSSTPIPTPSSTPTQIGFAGTWEGHLTVPELGTESVTAYLEQNGNYVTGNAITSDGCNGTITGTIEGSILNFTVNGKKSNNCCKTTYKGTAIITCEEDHMFMTFTLKLKSNCSGKYVGSGEFWKQ